MIVMSHSQKSKYFFFILLDFELFSLCLLSVLQGISAKHFLELDSPLWACWNTLDLQLYQKLMLWEYCVLQIYN